MNQETASFVFTFGLSFCLTLLLTPMMIKLGHRWNITAKAGGRRISEGDMRGVSKLGGAAVFLGFTISTVIAQFLPIPRFDEAELTRFVGLILGGTLLFVVTLFDDVWELSPVQLGVAQILVAGIAVAAQIFIESFNNPFTGQQTDPWPHIITVTLSMFWLGLMMNTVNFMDGLDGLVSGVALIAGTMLFINSAFVLDPAQISVSLLPLGLMGSSAAFLIFNFYPAQVFLGGGAFYIGYLLGTLSIIGGAKMATILLVMGLPLMDLAWQIANRVRHGRNPMHGDRGHLHFRLLDIGLGQRQIVLIYYLFCSSFGALTLLTTSRMFKFITFGAMSLLIGIGFLLLSRTSQDSSSTSS